MQMIMDVHPDEAKAIKRGKRRCSCDARELSRLGRRCGDIALQIGARSWSIYPLPGTQMGVPKVWVDWHSWPEMGMCNFKKPLGKKRYWWDVRPIPEWMNPKDELAEKDKDGHFDTDA